MTLTHSDAFIEHWAKVFETGRVREMLDITFEEFLRAPKSCCHAAATMLRIEHETFAPLLPAQRAIQRRLDLADLDENAVSLALRRMDSGMATATDAELIRRALSFSRVGRRILASCDGVADRVTRMNGADADAGAAQRFARVERAA